MKLYPLKFFQVGIVLLLLMTILQSKKCNNSNSNPPPPTGAWMQITVNTGAYGFYPNTSTCNFTGPEPFSDPDHDAGTCSSNYSSPYEQKRHYTKVIVRYAGLSTNLREYCWNSGSPLVIEVPIDRDHNRALAIDFQSKERCRYCTPNSSGSTRAVWKDSKYYTWTEFIPNTISFTPLWNNYEFDNYCP